MEAVVEDVDYGSNLFKSSCLCDVRLIYSNVYLYNQDARRVHTRLAGKTGDHALLPPKETKMLNKRHDVVRRRRGKELNILIKCVVQCRSLCIEDMFDALI